jgi:hypothetical protein
MTTLADGGRITERLVEDEIARLKANWIEVHNDDLSQLLSADQLEQIDAFDRLQLQSDAAAATVLRRPGCSAATLHHPWFAAVQPGLLSGRSSHATHPALTLSSECHLRSSVWATPMHINMTLN